MNEDRNQDPKPGRSSAWFNRGEKCQMLKESSPMKGTKMVEDIKKDTVAKADPKVKGELSKILQEYGGIFLEKLPFGPPLWWVVDHEIKAVPRSTPLYKSLYRLNNVKMEESRMQVDTLLEQGWI